MLCQNPILERHARSECSLIVKFLLQSSPELLDTGHPLVEVAHATRRVIILYAVFSHTAQALLSHRLVVPALGLYVVDLHILVVNLATAIGAMPIILCINFLTYTLIRCSWHNFIIFSRFSNRDKLLSARLSLNHIRRCAFRIKILIQFNLDLQVVGKSSQFVLKFLVCHTYSSHSILHVAI